MQCSEFAQFLESQPDGPLSNAAAGHLNDCSVCRILWHDLEGIRTAALDWGADEPLPPPRIWAAVRAQLESEGLIRETAPVNWADTFFGWASRPALAGAYLSLVLIAGSLLGFHSFSFANLGPSDEASLVPVPSAIASDLDRTLDGDLKRVMASIPKEDSSLTTSLQKNLGIVDNLIAVCEKSVREQPDNQMAREYLYGAYQQKAVLLATATDRSTLEGR